jgi:hypothetical protein
MGRGTEERITARGTEEKGGTGIPLVPSVPPAFFHSSVSGLVFWLIDGEEYPPNALCPGAVGAGNNKVIVRCGLPGVDHPSGRALAPRSAHRCTRARPGGARGADSLAAAVEEACRKFCDEMEPWCAGVESPRCWGAPWAWQSGSSPTSPPSACGRKCPRLSMHCVNRCRGGPPRKRRPRAPRCWRTCLGCRPTCWAKMGCAW